MSEIKDLTELTGPAQDDLVHVQTSSNDSRKVQLANLLAGRAPVFTYAALTALTVANYTGGVAYCSDGRKTGEGAGLGTGVLVYCDGADWYRVSDDSVVVN